MGSGFYLNMARLGFPMNASGYTAKYETTLKFSAVLRVFFNNSIASFPDSPVQPRKIAQV